MTKHIETVRSVIDAWRRLDIDGVLGVVAVDAVDPPLVQHERAAQIPNRRTRVGAG